MGVGEGENVSLTPTRTGKGHGTLLLHDCAKTAHRSPNISLDKRDEEA